MVTRRGGRQGIDAEQVIVGQGVLIGTGARISANSVHLADGVSIGDDVSIACDELTLGTDVRVGARSTIVSPRIDIGARSRLGAGLRAELNEHLTLGRLCDVGESIRLVGQGVRAGDHLWMTNDVVVGGGGARGPRSYLVIGDRAAIMDRCFINLSDEVSIGSDTALSNGVTVLTHSLWQPVLDGGSISFAPVRIGDGCIVYVNAMIAPGVTIGRDATIGAGALVLQDVPDASTAVGNPARVMKSTPPMPRQLPPDRQDAILQDVLRDWVTTLSVKGVSADYDETRKSVTAMPWYGREVVSYITCAASPTTPGGTTISLAFGPALSEVRARCHIDLLARSVTGELFALGEDLRDHLRRHTIRIFTNDPFQALPPANLDRLRARLHADR